MNLEIRLNNYKKCDGCPFLEKVGFLTRFFAYNTFEKLYYCNMGYDWKRNNTRRPAQCIKECGR